MIGIITKNTPSADGQLWELKCAIDEGVRLFLIHGHRKAAERLTTLPVPISGRKIYNWTEDNIVSFLNRI